MAGEATRGYKLGFFKPSWVGIDAFDWKLGAWLGLVAMVTGGVFLSLVAEVQALALLPLAILLMTSGWFTIQFARLSRVTSLQSTHRREDDRRLKLRELYLYLIISLAILTATAMSAKDGTLMSMFAIDLSGKNALHRWIYFVCLGFAFVPTIIGIIRTESRVGDILRRDAISTGSLVFGLFALGLITLLAWAAGRKAFEGVKFDMGIAATLLIVCSFAFFIVLSSVSRGINIFGERDKPVRADAAAGIAAPFSPAVWASWIDSILVRVIAPLTGATQARDGHHGLGMHHLLIVGIMAPLTVLGYALPKPYGLAPIVCAFLFALAIGRRWSWVEADREAAARLRKTKSKDIHIGFGNDLRDEALLAYAFLFVLVPMTLYQINDMTGAFCVSGADPKACVATAETGTFRDWISFFGLELFKAVPLVDWAEIYNFKPVPKIIEADATATIGKHLIFGARVLVDFVVMAALFQAVSIFQRNRTQKKLYNSGQLDVFDPITEEEFFEHGMTSVPGESNRMSDDNYFPAVDVSKCDNSIIAIGHGTKRKFFAAKKAFAERVDRHLANQDEADIKWPYDRKRLNELVSDPREDLQAGAKWMISKYNLLAGDPKNQLVQLSDRWRSMNFNASSDESDAFVEKQNFEDVLNSCFESGDYLTAAELGHLSFLMAETLGRPEFSYAHIRALRLLGEQRIVMSVDLLAASVMTAQKMQGHEELNDGLDRAFGINKTKLRQGQDPMRVHAYRALERMGLRTIRGEGHRVSETALRRALDLVTYMGPDEATGSKRAAEKAQKTLVRALKAIRRHT